MSTVFEFQSVAEMTATFRGERAGFVYSRYSNPTLELVEGHLASLEGAEAALATSSGMAAISTALMAVLSSGDHVAAAADLYGGTRNLLQGVLERFGVTVTYFPVEDIQALEAGLRPRTRVVYVESPTNPTLRIADLRRISLLARDHQIAVITDNTFATPILQRPLELGCDVVVHSATKFLAGHDDVTAGFVVGSRSLVEKAREVMKWVGGCLDPHAAWLLERGLKTLALRIARQCDNAEAIADWLTRQPQVRRVHYPGLASQSGHEIAAGQMSRFGGLVAFELAGGGAAVERFTQNVRLMTLAPSLGGVETVFLVPAASSHIRLTPEERRTTGISDGLIRVSCGIEDPADLIEDLRRGLAGQGGA